MKRRGHWFIAFMTCLSSWFAAERAWACACCDGESQVEPLGWTKAGELILRHEERKGCEHRVMLEVYNPGAVTPARCHDLFGDPSQRIACNKVTAPLEGKPKSAANVQQGLLPITSANPAKLQGSYFIRPAEGQRPGKLALIDVTAASPKSLLQLDVNEYEYRSPADEPTELFPLEFIVLPMPKAEGGSNADRKAAVIVRGTDTMLGIGHRGFVIKWITLDQHIGAVANATWVRAVPSFRSPAASEPARAPQLNTAGLALLEKGKLSAARSSFESALEWNPGHALSRYNLACTLTRENQPRAALYQLGELFSNADKSVVSDRRARALVDSDLAALRSDPEFERVVCGGPCPGAAPVASAVASSVPADPNVQATSPAKTPVANPNPSVAAPNPSGATQGPALTSQVPAAPTTAPPKDGCGMTLSAPEGGVSGYGWALALIVLGVRRRAENGSREGRSARFETRSKT